MTTDNNRKALGWMDDTRSVNKLARATFAPPATTFFEHALEDSARPGVTMVTESRNGSTAVLVRLPNEVHTKLKAMTDGAYTVAVAALVDFALHELQRTGQRLTVRSKPQG